MPLDIPSFAYAVAVAGGGILGYVKSKSIPSLGAGLLFGSILGYGAYEISQDPHNYKIFLGTNVALGGLMGYRYYNTGKIMPAGIITALSLAMIVRVFYKSFTTPHKILGMDK